MSKIFFASQLEGVATYWRIFRRDGVALGFTSHNRDLWFDGLLHRAAPGMVPSSILRTADLSHDSAEMQGALTHDALSAADLTLGRYDAAEVEVGIVDWETLDAESLFAGSIGMVAQEGAGFSAELQSIKALLDNDPIPRTSPTCRAEFCGPGCSLSAAMFTQELSLAASPIGDQQLSFGLTDHSPYLFGRIRWIDGPMAGLTSQVIGADADGVTVAEPLEVEIAIGTRVQMRKGCDHTLATCASRFDNAINFQGEPFLPGNDLLAQYPDAR